MQNQNKNNSNQSSKNNIFKMIIKELGFVLGALLYSGGLALFFKPGQITVGGFSGISLLVSRYIPSISSGVLLLIMNIPMVIICSRVFGLKFILKSIAGVAVTSLLIDVFGWVHLFNLDTLPKELFALFGGVLEGAGLGFLYMNGYTTGGTDLVTWLLRLKLPHVNMGTILFILDAIVVGGGALIEALISNDISLISRSILYSVIAMFSYTKALDTVMGSNERLHLVFIISRKYEQIADKITNFLRRGVTIIDGRGWFTKENRPMIMCVIDRTQVYDFRHLLNEYDPDAFFILADAREVLGQGFKDINPLNWDKKKEINIDKWNK